VAPRTDSFDLGRLGLVSGEAASLDLTVPLDPLELGGERYAVPAGTVDARLDVSHTTSGWALRLRFVAELEGPCMRCLREADRAVEVDAREVDQPGGGEDLDSPYVESDELRVREWSRDALALALPAQVVCRDDCPGLCPVCGADLQEAGPEHRHDEAPDPRWAKLSELHFE
jgi:uncharacterized protein